MKAQPNQILESCGSTNELAKQLALDGHPPGTWVCAREQTSGKGRLGREWDSKRGNLFLSVILNVKSPTNLTWLPLATAVALRDSLSFRLKGAAVLIKWPNDLWWESRKLAGVLCENAPGAPGMTVVGIGLNLESAPAPAVSLKEILAVAPQVDEVVPEVVRSLMKWVAQLNADGPAQVRSFYESHALFTPGTAVQWGEEVRPEVGVVSGLGVHGELLVRGPSGSERQLFAEDVFRVRGN